MSRVERIHIYPVTERNRTTHETTKSGECWCEPTPRQVCAEARWNRRRQEYECAESCFRCGGAVCVLPYAEGEAILLMHSLTQREEPPEMRRKARIA